MTAHHHIAPLDKARALQVTAMMCLIETRIAAGEAGNLLEAFKKSGLGTIGTFGGKLPTLTLYGIRAVGQTNSAESLLTAWGHTARARILESL